MKKKLVIDNPFKTGDETIDRTVGEIYIHLRTIASFINATLSENSPTSAGRTGQISIIEKDDGSYAIRGKTKKGWIEFTGTSSAFVKSKS